MTYKHISDLITAKQKAVCSQRNLPYIRLQLSLLYQFISEVEADLQRRIQIVQNVDPVDFSEVKTYANEDGIEYVDEAGVYYVTSSGVAIYDLPNDYGNMITLTVNGEKATEKTIAEFYNELSTATELMYTIIATEGKILLKFGPYDVAPGSEDTILPVYYKTIQPFRERNITGNTDVELPNDYQTAITLGVLKVIFPDYDGHYEREVRRIRSFRNSRGKRSFDGQNLGGISNG